MLEHEWIAGAKISNLWLYLRCFSKALSMEVSFMRVEVVSAEKMSG